MSKMNEDASLLQKPITYGNIFGAVGKLGSDSVLPEDAALMQSAEARTFGQTQKDGAASVMQAAAELNVKAGFVEKDAHSQVAEKGVMAQEILVPGMYNYFHDNVIDLVYAIRLRVCFLNHCNFMPPTFTRH